MNNNQKVDYQAQPLNSWQQRYEEVTKQYLDAIPLQQEAMACYNWRHGITIDQVHPYSIEYPGF